MERTFNGKKKYVHNIQRGHIRLMVKIHSYPDPDLKSSVDPGISSHDELLLK